MMILTIILRVYDLYNHYFQECRRCHQEMEEQPEQTNHNEKILALYSQGKSYVEIAKELGLGQGEVRLVVGLYKGVDTSEV